MNEILKVYLEMGIITSNVLVFLATQDGTNKRETLFFRVLIYFILMLFWFPLILVAVAFGEV